VLWKLKKNLSFLNMLKKLQKAESRLFLTFLKIQPEMQLICQKAKELGADGLMLLPPMRYKADNREVVEYFKAVASATDLPILIYNNPVDYGIHVTLKCLMNY
jgi:ribosome biogenesis protein Tsr3